MPFGTRHVNIVLKWMEEQPDVPRHIANQLNFLKEAAFDLAVGLGLSEKEVLGALIRMGPRATQYMGELMDTSKELANVEPLTTETAAFTAMMNIFTQAFAKSDVTFKKFNDTMLEMVDVTKEGRRSIYEISSRMLGAAISAVKENQLELSDAVNDTSKTYQELAERQKEASRQPFPSRGDINAVQVWAKRQYDSAIEVKHHAEELDRLVQQTIEHEGVISDATAREFAAITPLVKRDDWINRVRKTFLKYLDTEKEQETRSKSMLKNLSKQTMRWSWFGYRLISIGRIMQRWITAPVRGIINLFSNMESAIEQAAIGFALAERYGSDLGMTQEELGELFGDFVDTSLNVQQAFGEVRLAFMQMAVDIGPVLADALRDIAATLRDIWETHGPEIVKAFQDLVDNVLPDLMKLLKDIGAEAIIAFVDGFKKGTDNLVAFADTFKPIIPYLSEALGYISGLGPAFFAIGFALFFLTPALSALVTLKGLLTGAGGIATTSAATGLAATVGQLKQFAAAMFTAAIAGSLFGNAMKEFHKAVGLPIDPLENLFNIMEQTQRELFGGIFGKPQGTGVPVAYGQPLPAGETYIDQTFIVQGMTMADDVMQQLDKTVTDAMDEAFRRLGISVPLTSRGK